MFTFFFLLFLCKIVKILQEFVEIWRTIHKEKILRGMYIMDELKVLSRRVKMIRLAQGVSQTKMAEEIGVSQTNLSNMESGRTAITTQNLFKIQKVLGCKMADFFVDFDGEEPKKEENLEGKAIELEDALTLLKLLKSMNIKGL